MATPGPALSPEFAVAYRDLMLDGLPGEVEKTRKVLAAVPDDKSDYRPDPCARTAWELAWHLAHSDVQFLDGIADAKFGMGPEAKPVPDKPNNVAELVAWYDRHIARSADRVRGLSPEELLTPISFFGVFNLPAALYLGFFNNHSIHHRGELATYLRPMGSKCPSIYGGSYDEPFQPPAHAEDTAA